MNPMVSAAVRKARTDIQSADAALDLVSVSGGEPAVLRDPARGFRHAGEFFSAVISAGRNSAAPTDERLRIMAAAPSTFGSEGVGQDGGFAIPPAFARDIQSFANTEDALLPWCDTTPILGNSMVFPKDETTPWGTDGPRAYWQAEATAATATKPKIGTTTLRFSKLLALVPLSDELLTDGPALAAYLPKRLGAAIRWKTNEAILFGAGNGQPQGALNSAAAITVAKEAAQATQTFDPNNFRKMIARMPPGSYSRAAWLLGPDTVPALLGVNFGSFFLDDIDADDSLPPGLGGPLFKILGRPAYESQHTAAFSAQADICLLDLSMYRAAVRANDPNVQISLHLYFDADAAALRVVTRMDGQPKIVAPLMQAKGTNTLSPFVQLAAR